MFDPSENFDDETFNPFAAPEKLCWQLLPHMTGEMRGNTLLALGHHAYQRNEYGHAAALADQAAEVWREVGEFVMEYQSLSNAAKSYREIGEYSDAIDRYRRALQGLIENDMLSIAGEVCTSLAPLLRKTGHLMEARKTHLQGIDLAKKGDSAASYFRTVKETADFLFTIGHTEEAENILLEATGELTGKIEASKMAVLYEALGDVYWVDEKYELAKDFLTDAKHLAEAFEDAEAQARINHSLGEIAICCYRNRDAQEYCETAASFAAEIRSSYFAARALILGAKICINNENYDEALNKVSRALSVCRLEGNGFLESQAHMAGAHAAVMKDDIDLALFHLELIGSGAGELPIQKKYSAQRFPVDALKGLVVLKAADLGREMEIIVDHEDGYIQLAQMCINNQNPSTEWIDYFIALDTYRIDPAEQYFMIENAQRIIKLLPDGELMGRRARVQHIAERENQLW